MVNGQERILPKCCIGPESHPMDADESSLGAVPQVLLRPGLRFACGAKRSACSGLWQTLPMPLLALTGGIAAGKSTISRMLQEHGALIVDADAIVREVQAPGSPVLDEIAAQFGREMLDAEGALDRAALGTRVFGDPEALGRLNAIVHPAVQRRAMERIQDALASGPDTVVIYDIPLLLEKRDSDPWSLVVVAEAPAEVRTQRLVTQRGMSAADAAARVGSQISDAQRRAIADVVIDTTGTMADTQRQVDELWERVAVRV